MLLAAGVGVGLATTRHSAAPTAQPLVVLSVHQGATAAGANPGTGVSGVAGLVGKPFGTQVTLNLKMKGPLECQVVAVSRTGARTRDSHLVRATGRLWRNPPSRAPAHPRLDHDQDRRSGPDQRRPGNHRRHYGLRLRGSSPGLAAARSALAVRTLRQGLPWGHAARRTRRPPPGPKVAACAYPARAAGGRREVSSTLGPWRRGRLGGRHQRHRAAAPAGSCPHWRAAPAWRRTPPQRREHDDPANPPARSALAAERMPPSIHRRPLITTGGHTPAPRNSR